LSTPPGPLYRRPCLEQSWKTTVEKADTNKKCIQEKGQGRARPHRSHNGAREDRKKYIGKKKVLEYCNGLA
jgi:hypothetical protein